MVKDTLYKKWARPMVEWISQFTVDWPTYRAQASQEEFKRACKIRHELHKLEEEYAPLCFETWSEPKWRRRKQRYNGDSLRKVVWNNDEFKSVIDGLNQDKGVGKHRQRKFWS